MNTAINTTFHPDRVIGIINQFQARIAQEMPYHKARWWGDMNNWNNEVEKLRTFATARNTFMRQHMAQFFGLNETVNISTEVKQGEGKLRMNDVTAEGSVTQPYFKNLPVRMEPVPALGYAFKEWRIKKTEAQSVSLIPLGAPWKYYDQENMPTGWNTDSFNDNTWPEGPAQLGYGEGDEQTVVSYGPNASNKYTTTYFRKSFIVADTVGLTPLTGSILVDDGAVIYLNGVEMTRTNMPGGVISYSTFALNAAAEGTYTAFVIPKGLIKPSSNVLAVEVHQNNAGSSDLSFDLALSTVRLGDETIETSAVPLQLDTAFTNISYEAYFEPSGTVITGIVINEFSTSPSALLDNAGEAEDWIELYNAGSQTVNLAGLFITDNLNNRTKYQLPEGEGDELIVEPGEYKILWADEDLGQGADHVDFKLSNDGEAIGLYQVMGEHIHKIDEYVFPAQPAEGSFSRMPNATGPFIFTKNSTPNALNEIITAVEQDELRVRAYPNPVTDYLYIDSPYPLQHLSLSDCLGRPLQSFTHVVPQRIPMAGNPPGIYILRLKSSNRMKTLKIIKE
ncbi:MAG TPA: lamin tail domain-containing protein, partial [Cyclobacteriaceae bacterium]|nr:lamin tail domain-containing protein [Cyclobacteriaceae bacterium]